MTTTSEQGGRSRESGLQVLADIARRPLRFRPDFPDVARRWEAWWRCEATRPLLLVSAPKRKDLYWGKAFDHMGQPAEWLRLRRLQVENTHYAGDSIPSIRVDIGPVATAAFLGAPLHLSESEQTSWQDPTIDDWRARPALTLSPDQPVWRQVLELTLFTAQDAAGKYLVCFPDLTGAIDVLANMRGPERLCMDLYDEREAVKQAALEVVDAWHAAFEALHTAALDAGAGVIQWVGAWSSAPHTVPTCDFNALIGGDDFADVCLPSLRKQAGLAGRAVLHLDGPAAARHAVALAAEPHIQAIQYTPGAGTPSALAMLDMLRMLQRAGKPILVMCPAEEVEALAGALDPRGLALCPSGVATPADADAMAERLERAFR